MDTVTRVLVLGGGSAGFMAGIALKAKNPALEVRVLRSKDIGIIGVGEGSTLALTRFLHEFVGVGPKKFFEVAQPTWKLGLRFLWGSRPYFNYSFGPGMDWRPDGQLPKANGFYCSDEMEYSDATSAYMTHDRVFERRGNLPVLHQQLAYHFENEKFVRFLEGYATALGIAVVDDTVSEVKRDDRGVAGLALASGATETADLYIDCSGFASVLLGKALGEPFVSFAPSLFCDRAVVGGWDRKDSPDAQDQVIKPYTTCETMDSGWCWQIEHENRINRGYVYGSAFISDDAAEREFRQKNPRVGPTRIVRFVSGRYQRAWVGNVVAIGNASGFVEPLEATALGAIAMQSRLLSECLRETGGELRPSQRELFNRFNAANWDSIRGCLALHYRFNDRLDTPFWRACRADADLAGAERVVDYYQENGPTGLWGSFLLNNEYDQFQIGGYMTLLVGMRVPYRSNYTPSDRDLKLWESRRQRNREAALRAMTVKEALAAIRSPGWKWA